MADCPCGAGWRNRRYKASSLLCHRESPPHGTRAWRGSEFHATSCSSSSDLWTGGARHESLRRHDGWRPVDGLVVTHAGELGAVRGVHALVAELPDQLVDALEAAHDVVEADWALLAQSASGARRPCRRAGSAPCRPDYDEGGCCLRGARMGVSPRPRRPRHPRASRTTIARCTPRCGGGGPCRGRCGCRSRASWCPRLRR